MELTETSSISADQMRMVLDVARLLAVTADLDTLLLRIAKSATSLLNAERASIFLHDPGRNELWTRVALGAKEIRVPDTAGIVGHVFQSNEQLYVARPYDDPRFNPEPDRLSGFVTRNLLTAPARDMTRRPIGVLQVVNRIGGDFTENDSLMVEMLADEAGVAIQRHYLQQEVIKSAGLRHEMQLAQRVQAAMIPASPPQIPGLSAVGWTRPASVTGGDSYDLWPIRNGRLGVFVGDASGHGIAPAIVISQARTLLRALCDINPDPHWLLSSVNGRLIQDLEPGMFATVFAGNIGPDGEVLWCSAGHGPILVKRAAGRPFDLLEPLGPPIGVVADLRCDPPQAIHLEPGGVLAVISDGIYEARDPAGRLMETQRVVDLMNAHAESSPHRLLETLRHFIRGWQGGDEPVDDQTIVLVQRD